MSQLERWLHERIQDPNCPVHYIQIYHELFRRN